MSLRRLKEGLRKGGIGHPIAQLTAGTGWLGPDWPA